MASALDNDHEYRDRYRSIEGDEQTANFGQAILDNNATDSHDADSRAAFRAALEIIWASHRCKKEGTGFPIKRWH